MRERWGDCKREAYAQSTETNTLNIQHCQEERAKLPTLLNRRLQDICILMYKVKHNLSPPNICDTFKGHNSSYNLRQSDFSTSRYNTVTYGKHSLRYLGPKLWGKLDITTRSAESLNIFKNIIRKRNISLLLDDGCKNCSLCNS